MVQIHRGVFLLISLFRIARGAATVRGANQHGARSAEGRKRRKRGANNNRKILRTRMDSSARKRKNVKADDAQARKADRGEPVLKRMRGKQPDPRNVVPLEELPPDVYEMRVLPRGSGNDDPRAEREQFIQEVAAALLPWPTLPEKFQGLRGQEVGFDLPNVHCAFRGCGWEGKQKLICNNT